MKIDLIKADQLNARKAKLKSRADILTVLYSECNIIGKNNGNRKTTDQECETQISKSLKNALENEKLGMEVQEEIAIYKSYLPQKMTPEELKEVIIKLIHKESVQDVKGMGLVMKTLKTEFTNMYDGKLASTIFKEVINA